MQSDDDLGLSAVHVICDSLRLFLLLKGFLYLFILRDRHFVCTGNAEHGGKCHKDYE